MWHLEPSLTEAETVFAGAEDAKQRRAFLRFFACEEDLSHVRPDELLPEAVVSGEEPLLVIGAIAGG